MKITIEHRCTLGNEDPTPDVCIRCDICMYAQEIAISNGREYVWTGNAWEVIE